MSGRWVNKAKFHHLQHLTQSIEHLGNARLFATERFESYNGVIRQSSIHSNRQAPGRDIATSFRNYSIMRLFLSGARLYDHERKRYFEASDNVKQLFTSNPILQGSLGYNSCLTQIKSQRPQLHGKRMKPKDMEEIPYTLTNRFPNSDITIVSSIKIGDNNIVRPGTFVLVRTHQNQPHFLIIGNN